MQQPPDMETRDFDYDLPKDRIAQYPADGRESSRLMVLLRDRREIVHTRFSEIADWLDPGDLLVTNDTRVIPARLFGTKPTGGKVEILLTAPLNASGDPIPPVAEKGAFRSNRWRCFVKGHGRMRDPVEIRLSDSNNAKSNGHPISAILRKPDDDWEIDFQEGTDVSKLLEQKGRIPLPPYIRRSPEALDEERYQTLFAGRDGSIAAPTAALHFSRPLIDRLSEKGLSWRSVTLQVGAGTFLPVKSERVEDHHLLEEYVEIGDSCCSAWKKAKDDSKRVVAVGTTTVRAMESAMDEGGGLKPFEGFTSLFILPGHRFRAMDALITNFHLPKSTLLMLVSAFAGREFIKEAYAEAVRSGYRFYSYGDAMLIL